MLASLTVALEGEPAADEAPFTARGESFLWQQPDRDFALAGIGQAVRLTATGEQRFREVDEKFTHLVEGAVILDESDGALAQPVALGGFAFAARGESEAQEWRAFPDALAVLPRLLIAQASNRRSLTVNHLVGAEEDIDATAATLQRELDALDMRSEVAQPHHGLLTLVDGQRERWLQDVRELTALIDADEAEKVVLARRLEVQASAPFDVASVLERLCSRYPDCTVFASGNEDSTFLGATPEMLVRLDGGIVQADCLAGSAARGSDGIEDEALGLALLKDDKERREHEMVVRGLKEALRDVCSEVEATDTPSVRKMANLQHLHTPLTARMNGERHILELVERLHPTPAVGGLPLRRALCLIGQHERFSRGWYAGPIGWMDAKGNGEFAVALRSALVSDRRAFLYAGCGIVAGSDPEREYEESQLKLQAMLWALNGSS